jgi:hypothetical protein
MTDARPAARTAPQRVNKATQRPAKEPKPLPGHLGNFARPGLVAVYDEPKPEK